MTWTICNNKHSFLATRNTPSLNPSKYPSLFNFSSTILYHWPYVLIIGHSFSPAKCVFSLNTWATVITLSTTESCSTSSYTSIIPNLTDLVNWLNSFSFYFSFFLFVLIPSLIFHEALLIQRFGRLADEETVENIFYENLLVKQWHFAGISLQNWEKDWNFSGNPVFPPKPNEYKSIAQFKYKLFNLKFPLIHDLILCHNKQRKCLMITRVRCQWNGSRYTSRPSVISTIISVTNTLFLFLSLS